MHSAPNNTDGQPEGILCEELACNLEKMVRLMQDNLHSSNGVKGSLALVRVLEGIDQQSWERFASTYGLESWLSIPLHRDPATAVRSLISLQERLAFQRDHDALTGIGNRGYFNRRLDTEIQRALRSRAELSLLYLDLDSFKIVNDTYGHACGDVVLQRLGRVMQNSVRHYDVVARIGGEEFAVILPSTTCWTGLMLGNRLLDTFRKEEFTCNGVTFSMTFSGGVSSLSLLDGDEKNSEGLLRSADQALYKAKASGKNSVVLAESDKLDKDRASLVQAQEKQFLFSGLDTE